MPLPYAWLEHVFPALRLGGCVNRFEQLALLALAVSFGFWVDRLRPRPALAAAAVSLAFVEYVPWRIPVETWPLTPADPALEALARDRSGSVVLDVEGGTGALVRQLVHGHPLVSGYLSRNPLEAVARRRDDPVLRMLGDPAAAVPWSADAIAAHLELGFHTRFVVAPDTDAWARHLREAGLVPFARSPGRTLVERTAGVTSSSPRSTSRAR